MEPNAEYLYRIDYPANPPDGFQPLIRSHAASVTPVIEDEQRSGGYRAQMQSRRRTMHTKPMQESEGEFGGNPFIISGR